jgi:hypothetical protein
MIVATPSEVSELPARMNNKYAALEVVPCDFCQERPPVPGLPWCQRCARKGRS